jgi:hypothetical protein
MSTATSEYAKKALDTLRGASGSATLDTSNPFGFITDKNTIQGALDKAANAAYDVKMREANLGLSKAEDSAYANTQNAISELRRAMAGGVGGGANRGATGAAMIQALLGLGQQNTGLVTEGLQNIQGIAGERASALAQNAVTALEQANQAKGQQATAASEKYTADQTRSAEALAALSALAGTVDTNVRNERMNNATNAINQAIANTTQKSQVTYYNR